MTNEDDFLKRYDPRAFAPVAVTADVVALTIRQAQLCVLLVKRARPPFEGRWALPGSFLRPHQTVDGSEQWESLEQAAIRALADKTGLSAASVPEILSGIHLEQLCSYGGPGRDPRMTVVSVAYMAFGPDFSEPQAGPGTSEARWVPVTALNLTVERGQVAGSEFPLAFDHAQIVYDGLERARAKLEYTGLATAFLEEPFTLAQVRRVYEIVWNEKIHPSNFARKLLSARHLLVATGENTARGSAAGGRRSALYRRGDSLVLMPPILRKELRHV
jgi:8-oxo-dGTP diphosphatase